MRRSYGPEYKVHPAGERDEYCVTIFLDRNDPKSERSIGYDMLSDPSRKAAMSRARDSGLISATGNVALSQAANGGKRTGVLFYAPVYRGADAPAGDKARRAAIMGFVYAPLLIRDFVDGLTARALGERRRLMRIELFDSGQGGRSEIMFDSTPEGNGSAGNFRAAATLDQNGRHWVFRFTSLPQFDAGMVSGRARGGLAIGLGLSLLVGALAASLAMRQIDMADANSQMALFDQGAQPPGQEHARHRPIHRQSQSFRRPLDLGGTRGLQELPSCAGAHTFLLDSGWSGADLESW